MDNLFNMEDGQVVEDMDHSASDNSQQILPENMPSDSELERSKFTLELLAN
jgi:hypothetical protein